MLRRPAGQRRNFLLVCASAVIGLYLLEALFAVYPRLAIGLAREFCAWDIRSKLRVIADLRAEGKRLPNTEEAEKDHDLLYDRIADLDDMVLETPVRDRPQAGTSAFTANSPLESRGRS